MGTKNLFKPGKSGNAKGAPKGRSINSWLERYYDEEVKVANDQRIEKRTRGELFALWIARTITNQDEHVTLRTACFNRVMDHIAPIVDGGINLPDIKILIVQDSPEQRNGIKMVESKSVNGDGNGHRLPHSTDA